MKISEEDGDAFRRQVKEFYDAAATPEQRHWRKQMLHAFVYGGPTGLRNGRQTWWGSIVEAKANIAVGFGVSYAMNFAILPFFGMQGLTPANNLGITLAFTVVSIIRQLIMRRFFNRLKWGHK